MGASTITAGQGVKRALRSLLPLAFRRRLAIWVGGQGWLSSRYWWCLELLRDFAERDPNGFHRFLWAHHLAYAETYEVDRRFGAERLNRSRLMLFDDLRRCLQQRGLDPECEIHSVFEVGCSLGYLLRFLETGLFRSAEILEGIDLDEYAIRQGSEYLASQGSRVRLVASDMAGLDQVTAGRRYDVTLCAGVLMYLTPDEAGRVVRSILAHTGICAAFAGLAHPDRDNAGLERSEPRERDGTWIHNLDAMVRQAGGSILFRRWEGARQVDGNTIYFVFAAPEHP